MSPAARLSAALIAALALSASAMQFRYLLGRFTDNGIETLWLMALFFTTLTNLLAAVVFVGLAMGWFRRDALVLPALVTSLALVGGVYHLLLTELWTPTGIGLIADHLRHTVVPVAALIWWFVFAETSRLTVQTLPVHLIWPALYTAYATLRGGIERRYPYPFLDPAEIGWFEVVANLVQLAAVLLVLGGVLMILARIRPG